MKIITVPHPTLRTSAQRIMVVDKKLKQFSLDLAETLALKKNPRGVGLAAPQVDVKWRMFATQLSHHTRSDSPRGLDLRIFINPKIIDHSDTLTFGPDKKEPTLEGCLSIPGLYGPIPRWEDIKLEFQVIQENELRTRTETFTDFAARVVQHEEDHLNGVLFVDYTEKFDLPLYKEDMRTNELITLEDDMITALIDQTR